MVDAVKAISAILAAIILLAIGWDIIMIVASRFTGKPYKCQAFGIFYGDSSKWAILVIAGMFFVGTYTIVEMVADSAVSQISEEYESRISFYEEKEERAEEAKRECDACWKRYPEEYMYHDQSFGWVCPKCIYEVYSEVQALIQKQPNFLSEDSRVLDGGGCCECGDWAPESLHSPWGEPLCIDCANEFFALDSVWEAVNNYIEYGEE